ncbi:alpha/beta hydrolase [Sphingobium sufflavum]|uniref:alpha/beta hydrolase n=1 Tax=Sphingobium sufflavum TaxID=1129547 RepID=UPI001F191E2E|nr:alpha/beta hydrolase [Sphingobium sufflavum]MCE7795350.1 alpha/beta hydrolase [Sphingobium sufflavum]
MRYWAVVASAVLALSLAGPGSTEEVTPVAADLKYETTTLFGLEAHRLWPGRAPGATSDAPDETPVLTVFRPMRGTENGTAVIVAPGGGYMALAGAHEGRQVADWFASRGVTAFVLRYRVGPKARLPLPLLDGKRAVRFVRANAARLRIDPDRIGMIGFSAGGHLTATVAGEGDAGKPGDADPVEQAASRLSFAILAYPWLNGTVPDAQGKSQYCQFTRAECKAADYARYRPLNSVTAAFPPTFLFHTTTDSLVSPTGSIELYQALLANKVPVEMHVFAQGAHGVGLGGSDPALSRWPDLLDQWLRAQGLFARKPVAPKP